MWASGFLPTAYQGVPFRSGGDPILDLSRPSGISAEAQHETIRAIRDLNLSAMEESHVTAPAVVAIHVGAEGQRELTAVGSVRALAGKGLEGDRNFHPEGAESGRALTLVEEEASDRRVHQ